MIKSQRDLRSLSRNGVHENSGSLNDIELEEIRDQVDGPKEDMLKSNATFHPAVDRIPKSL
jgi:hypothetical protein